ncbi:DUF1513 domain-containing protein [Pseudoruegeria sp. HB172150]|uniref:DUF1513 domain-containing protein n=1 Tax=Pseudoruegeria sp. HB172150 TaxID=2721164 RepID=UPI00155684C2|nr:DUF1513 domain-containing protein [Pseudoruegeria sp. HB172150]
MSTRRGFLAGLVATGLIPKPSWADAGAPSYLAAGMLPSGDYNLFGLTETGAEIFRLPLPGRGHAAAAHPHRPEAVAFARRPGTFAIVIDCAKGEIEATLESPEGRHFMGHGTFSPDGTRLFTPENAYNETSGVIGIWDAEHGYARIGEFVSGGVGPHDICLLPGTDIFAIANGGIETHPDSGRTKLNIPIMRPNLSYATLQGELLETVELPREYHKNSLRHLSVRDDGLIAFAMQWEGDVNDNPPLAGLHRMGGEMVLAEAPADVHQRMRAYAGSVAFSESGDSFAITSPRGGEMQVFDSETAEFLSAVDSDDICGLSSGEGGFTYTTGKGIFGCVGGDSPRSPSRHEVAFDNHLVRIPSPDAA